MSFENPHEINLEDFESIQHKYFSFDHSYVIGKMCINNLLDEKWLNNPKNNIVLCAIGTENILGSLCVKGLNAEIEELKRGQQLLQKIIV